MKTKSLTAAQIDTLAQHLSEAPIAPSPSAKKAGVGGFLEAILDVAGAQAHSVLNWASVNLAGAQGDLGDEPRRQ